MKRSDCNSLAETAFRIYLMHLHRETIDSMVEYQTRLDICNSPAEKNDWQTVVRAASEVVLNTETCISEGFTCHFHSSGFHRICLIEAAQDALACALSNASLHHVGTYGRLYRNLTEDHSYRVMCMKNAITFTAKDPELAGLWAELAQHVYQQSQLRRAGSDGKIWSHKECFELKVSDEQKSLFISNDVGVVVVDQVTSELYASFLRCQGRVAVYALLNRPTDYLYAANTYLTASDYYEQAASACKQSEKLWRSAYSSMRLAAEMIEAQALSNSATGDELVSETIRLAQQLADDAEQVSTYLSDRDDMKSKLLHTQSLIATCNCKEPPVLAAWQIIAAAEEKTLQLWEKYLAMFVNCESKSVVAEETLKEFKEAKVVSSTIASMAKKLEQNLKAAEYYKSKANKSRHISHAQAQALWSDCYTKAADYSDRAAKLCAEIITNHLHAPVSPVAQGELHALSLHAQLFASCAGQIISTAVSYFNSSRGAGGAARDPRETLWWKAAAHFQLQVAVEYFAKLCILPKATLRDADVRTLVASPGGRQEEAREFANAADYLNRAYMFNDPKCPTPHAKRCAGLYTLAAELCLLGGGEGKSPQSIHKQAMSFALQLVDVVTEVNTIPVPGHVSTLERGCEYARHFSTPCTVARGKWEKAFHASYAAVVLLPSANVRQAHVEIARAALYAQSAQAYAQNNVRDSIACSIAATALVSTPEMSYVSDSLINYSLALAHRICSVHLKTALVPEELQKLQVDHLQPVIMQILDDHTRAAGLAIECHFQVTNVDQYLKAGKIWNEAKVEADYLSTNYLTQVKHFYLSGNEKLSRTNQIAMRKLSLECYMAAARSGCDTWDAVLSVCREAAGALRLPEAVVVIKRYLSLREERDAELAQLRTTAALAAREAMLASSDETEILGYGVKEADHRVLVLTAQRKGQSELATIYAQMADLWKTIATVSRPARGINELHMYREQRNAAHRELGVLRARAVELERSGVDTTSISDVLFGISDLS